MILIFNIDINECTANPSICHSLAVCKNTLGSYICQCPKGYKLGYDQFTCVGEYIILILQASTVCLYALKIAFCHFNHCPHYQI